MEPSRDIARLLGIMAALRNPDGGCPWDLEQDFKTIRHYTIEEAYEVADAIERGDFDDLCEELGDLLLQPVFTAEMAAEAKHFDFGDVVFAITQEMIRRHPHVFGEEAARSAGGAKAKWEEVKADERAKKAARKAADASILEDVPHNLPALTRAEKLSKRAAKVGFDWPDWTETLDEVREELDGAIAAAKRGRSTEARVAEELGDLLFAAANLARKLGVDPEAALRDANVKFTRRFAYVEARTQEDGVLLAKAGLDQLDRYWNEIRTRKETRPDQAASLPSMRPAKRCWNAALWRGSTLTSVDSTDLIGLIAGNDLCVAVEPAHICASRVLKFDAVGAARLRQDALDGGEELVEPSPVCAETGTCAATCP